MKLLRTLSLVFLTVLMTTVSIGPSSALAGGTTLCNEDPGTGSSEVCPEAHIETHLHAVSPEGHRVRLFDGTNTIARCEVLFLADSVKAATGPLLLEGQFTYTNCLNECSLTETSAHTMIEILKLGHETADVSGHANGEGKFEGEFHDVCSGTVDCYFNWEGLSLTAKGDLLSVYENGEISTLGKALKLHQVKGSLCPKEVTLELTLAPLSTTYVTSGPYTTLCNEDPGTGTSEVCPEGHSITHLHAATLENHRTVLLNASGITLVRCEALFLGDASTGSTGQLLLEGNFTYSSCVNGCSIKEESAHSTLQISKLGHETADVTGHANSKGEFEGLIHAVCESSKIDCYFDWKSLAATAKGPLLSTETNGEISVSEQELHQVKGSLCPEVTKLDITLTPLSATYVTY